jgi:hypothetical protein
VNKLTKVGLSALCGSLAAVSSANAGAMTVSGSATATYQSNAGATTGNPIGMNSGLTFTGSGELDGGQSFKYTITNADQAAFSAGSMSLTTNMLGTWRVGARDGASGIDSKDDVMPTAWEEVDGTGMSVGQDKVSGVGASMNIGWKSPTLLGSNLSLAYAPKNDGKAVNDKGSSGNAGGDTFQYGYDVLLDMNVNNSFYLPNIFIGGSTTHQEGDFKGSANGGIVSQNDDKYEAVAGFVWKVGPLSAGLQRSYENPATKTDDATEYYANTAWGVSFNVNDSLSLSYGEHKSHNSFTNNKEAVVSDAKSIQVAYTIGGVALKLAESEVDNAQYVSSGAGDLEGRTIAMSLAF